MKSLIKLNPKQLQYLKSLDSKKKKRKFLLDCFIEEIEVKNDWFSTTEKEVEDKLNKMAESLNVKENNLPKQIPILTGNPTIDSISIGISAIGNIREAYKSMDEKKEILEKSKEPQSPMEFCVKVTDENREVLRQIYRKDGDLTNVPFLKYFNRSNMVYTATKSDVERLPLVTTEEFLKYIGREDLIEKDIEVSFLNDIQTFLKGKSILLEIDEIQELEKIFLKYHESKNKLKEISLENICLKTKDGMYKYEVLSSVELNQEQLEKIRIFSSQLIRK